MNCFQGRSIFLLDATFNDRLVFSKNCRNFFKKMIFFKKSEKTVIFCPIPLKFYPDNPIFIPIMLFDIFTHLRPKKCVKTVT